MFYTLQLRDSLTVKMSYTESKRKEPKFRWLRAIWWNRDKQVLIGNVPVTWELTINNDQSMMLITGTLIQLIWCHAILCVQILGQVVPVQPYDACRPLQNPRDVEGRIALLERGSCMFMDKVWCVDSDKRIIGKN